MIKNFNEFDEERQEAIDAFEESEGYPLGKDFLFAPYKTEIWSPQGTSDGFQIIINPKSYWDNEKCCYDQHIDSILIDMPKGFGEACESDFEYDGDIEEAIKKLVDAGFKWSEQMQNFIDRGTSNYGPLSIGGKTIKQYIQDNHPNCIV